MFRTPLSSRANLPDYIMDSPVSGHYRAFPEYEQRLRCCSLPEHNFNCTPLPNKRRRKIANEEEAALWYKACGRGNCICRDDRDIVKLWNIEVLSDLYDRQSRQFPWENLIDLYIHRPFGELSKQPASNVVIENFASDKDLGRVEENYHWCLFKTVEVMYTYFGFSLRTFLERSEFMIDTKIWDNVVAAGGAVISALMNLSYDKSKCKDVDLFFYGLSESEILSKIAQLWILFGERRNDAKVHRTKNTISFVFYGDHSLECKKPIVIQCILRRYATIFHIIDNFDIDCACVAFAGNTFYTVARGMRAIKTRSNVVRVRHWVSTSYETRLLKYLDRGYSICDPNFDASKIDYSKVPLHIDGCSSLYMATGLYRLLLEEKRFHYRDKGILRWLLYQKHPNLMSTVVDEYDYGTAVLTMEDGDSVHHNPSVFVGDASSHQFVHHIPHGSIRPPWLEKKTAKEWIGTASCVFHCDE